MSVEDGSLRGWHEPDKSRGLRPVGKDTLG